MSGGMRQRGMTILLAAATVVPGVGAGAQAAPPQPDPIFKIDPVVDVTLTVAMTGASALTALILSTGEIAPQHVTPDSVNKVLSFDRGAITQTVDPHAGRNSNIGLGVAMGFAALDPVLSGFREGWGSALVDAVMYAESLSFTSFITDVTKIAVRRPRPIDYKNPSGSDTDAVLSYFSGHASMTAAAVGTASYLAFIRAPHTARPWITVGVGAALTAFVSYERVRSGAHFPTDVIAGSLAGASIGVLVPHLHRRRRLDLDLWFGFQPAPGGGTLALNRLF
jgi:membrane-associated phospholipid phosphatase